MMHGPEKSDLAIVAGKPTNKAERSAAEPVEPRAETKGNAGQHSTGRMQSRGTVSYGFRLIDSAGIPLAVGGQNQSGRTNHPETVSQALERIRQVRRYTPKVGAVCGKAARTVLCGGRSVMSVPTATAEPQLGSTWTQTQHLLSFFDRDHESHRLDRGGTESMPFVERLGLIRNRMNEDGADANGLRRSDRAQHGILQQVGAQPLAMPRAIDRQSTEQQDRYRVRHVAANPAGRSGVKD